MSKRQWHHPEVPASENGTKVWRSLGELEKTPQFRASLEREFPQGTSELTEEERELSRRSFVKLMGASTALAGFGLASCRRPEQYIQPYRNAPEWVIPGKPLYYATAMPAANGAIPLVVTTTEGRPTLLAPNRDHPSSAGVSSFAQSSILDLYSPDRSQIVLNKGVKSTKAALQSALKQVDLGKTAFLVGEDDSPTRSRLLKTLAGKGAKVYSYEALSGEGRKATEKEIFGSEVSLVPQFEQADRILALDSDFLELEAVSSVKEFYAKRNAGSQKEGKDYVAEIDPKQMNRLYAVESVYSVTGGMADHRLPVAPSQIHAVAGAIAKEVAAQTGNSELAVLAAVAPALNPAIASDAPLEEWAKNCAADLVSHRGHSLVFAGMRQSAPLQRLTIALNKALGAFGRTVKAFKKLNFSQGTLVDLAKAIEAGEIAHLISTTPANPCYDAPTDLKFEELLAKLTSSFSFGTRVHETAHKMTWHIPAAHYLESWGDVRAADGMYSIIQPMILPLYDGIGELELLSSLAFGAEIKPISETEVSTAQKEVEVTFASLDGSLSAWKETLKNGFHPKSFYGETSPRQVAVGAKVPAVPTPNKDRLELVFTTDYSVYDGRYIDNSWLQEAPDPIAKLTWDNVAYVSPQTAKDLGVYERLVKLEPTTPIFGVDVKNAPRPDIGEASDAAAPMVTLTVNGRSLEVPLMVSFGQADYTISLSLGYGQSAKDSRYCGLPGQESGFNAYQLRDQATSYLATGATIKASEGSYKVALTQEHHSIYGRALAREISAQPVNGHDFDYQLGHVKKQGVDSHAPENIPGYKPKGSKIWHDEDFAENVLSDKIHQWGMTIDLNSCTGCSACLIACQAENNIPVVGKSQVAMGREMHWIRMDRYFTNPTLAHKKKSDKDSHDDHGHDDHGGLPKWVEKNPEMIPQPVACQQCEAAPCEVVCPVNATVHTEEGLNAMAYNRCIGTRYCANNCPFGARRFNFFDYNKRNPLIEKNLYKGALGKKQEGDSKHLQRNPNVTVRMRGVMEKCTYCVQRLELGKIKQKQAHSSKVLAAGKPSAAVQINPEDLRVKSDAIRVACQDACPTNAIQFGNLLDQEKSTMFRAKQSKRNYDLLNYIGARPRTSYLARVKNPNPKMPDAKFVGLATVNVH